MPGSNDQFRSTYDLSTFTANGINGIGLGEESARSAFGFGISGGNIFNSSHSAVVFGAYYYPYGVFNGKAYVAGGPLIAPPPASGNIPITSGSSAFSHYFTFTGIANEAICSSVDVADVDGDGIDDIFCGNAGGGSVPGGGSWIRGGSYLRSITTFDPSTLNGVNGCRFTNLISTGDGCGYSVKIVKNMTGNGKPGFMLGCFGAFSDLGAVVVIPYSTNFCPGGTFTSTSLDGVKGTYYKGVVAGGKLGSIVDSANLHCNGGSSLIFGTFSNAGTYIKFAGPSVMAPPPILVSSIDMHLTGQSGDYSGLSIANLGDTKQNGCDNLMIGAYASSQLASFAGREDILFGSKNFSANTINLPGNLNGQNGLSIYSTKANQYLGQGGSSVGDVNADGKIDFTINAPNSSPNGRAQAGTVALCFGGSPAFQSNNKTLIYEDLIDGRTCIEFKGAQANDYTGIYIGSKGIGDWNRDGVNDWVLCSGYNSAFLGSGPLATCRIMFGDASPVLKFVSVNIPDGATIVFDTSNLVVTDVNHNASTFTYMLSNIKNGYFHLDTDPTPITSFKHALLASGRMRLTSRSDDPLHPGPFSFYIAVNTTGIAFLPPQPVGYPNINWIETIPPVSEKANIRYFQGKGSIQMTRNNLNASSIYASQNPADIQFDVHFDNFQFTSTLVDTFTNQTIPYQLTHGNLRDLDSGSIYGSQVGNGIPSGTVIYKSNNNATTTVPINFEYVGVVNSTAPGFLGAGSIPVCYRIKKSNIGIYNSIGTNPARNANPQNVRVNFLPGQNVIVTNDNDLTQGISIITGQDVELETKCFVSTNNEKPGLNFTVTETTTGETLGGTFSIDFSKFVYRPKVVNNDFTGNNAPTQGIAKEITPSMLYVTDSQNIPSTPDSEMDIVLISVTHATLTSTYGGGSKTLSLPQTIQQLNITNHNIFITPLISDPATPTVLVRVCGKQSCTDPFLFNMELKVQYPAPFLFFPFQTAQRGTDFAVNPVVTLYNAAGNQIPANLVSDMVKISCLPPSYGTIYDITNAGNDPEHPTPLNPVVAPLEDFQSGHIHCKTNGSNVPPDIKCKAFAVYPPQSGQGPNVEVANNDGYKSIPMDWQQAPKNLPKVPVQVINLARAQRIPLFLKGSSDSLDDSPESLRWSISSSTGLKFYYNTGTKLIAIDANDLNSFTFTPAEADAGLILVEAWDTNDQPSLTVQLTGADGSVPQSIGIKYEQVFYPPVITNPPTTKFIQVPEGTTRETASKRVVTPVDMKGNDNANLNSDETSLQWTRCFTPDSTCTIIGSNVNETSYLDGSHCVTGMNGLGISTNQYQWLWWGNKCDSNITVTKVNNNVPKTSIPQENFGIFDPAPPVNVQDNTLTYVGFGVTGFSIAAGCLARYFTHVKNVELEEFRKGAAGETNTVGGLLNSKILNNLTTRLTITHSLKKLGFSDKKKLEKYKSAILKIVNVFLEMGLIYQIGNEMTSGDHLDQIATVVVDVMLSLPVMTKRTKCNRCCTNVGCRRDIEPGDIGYEEVEASKCCSSCGCFSCSCIGCGPVEYTEEELEKAVDELKKAISKKNADNNKVDADVKIDIRPEGDEPPPPPPDQEEPQANTTNVSAKDEPKTKEGKRRQAIIDLTIYKLGPKFLDARLQEKQNAQKAASELPAHVKKLEADCEQLKKALKAVNKINNRSQRELAAVKKALQSVPGGLPFAIEVGGDNDAEDDDTAYSPTPATAAAKSKRPGTEANAVASAKSTANAKSVADEGASVVAFSEAGRQAAKGTGYSGAAKSKPKVSKTRGAGSNSSFGDLSAADSSASANNEGSVAIEIASLSNRA